MRELRDSLYAALTAVDPATGRFPTGAIGSALRAIYNEALSEPVPSDMLAALERIPEHPRVRR